MPLSRDDIQVQDDVHSRNLRKYAVFSSGSMGHRQRELVQISINRSDAGRSKLLIDECAGGHT